MKATLRFVALVGLTLAVSTLVGRASPPDHPSKIKHELYSPSAFTATAVEFNAVIVDNHTFAPAPKALDLVFLLPVNDYFLLKASYRPPENDGKPDNTVINGIINDQRWRVLRKTWTK